MCTKVATKHQSSFKLHYYRVSIIIIIMMYILHQTVNESTGKVYRRPYFVYLCANIKGIHYQSMTKSPENLLLIQLQKI